MRHLITLSAVAGLMLSTAAVAQEAAAPAAATAAASTDIKVGAVLRSANGKRVGRIERIVKDADGTPASVGLIYGSRFIRVPVATISNGASGLVTSLTSSNLDSLK